MKIFEIIQKEKTNTNKVFLIKEGIFWRSYEVSAILFIKNIKKFSLLTKFVKKISNNIVFIGFPDSSLESILKIVVEKGYKIESRSEKMIELSGFTEITNFVELKKEFVIIKKDEKDLFTGNCSDKIKNIINKIINYPVATQTPVETMNFVAEIQKEIKEC
jgi:hypothetical protein